MSTGLNCCRSAGQTLPSRSLAGSGSARTCSTLQLRQSEGRARHGEPGEKPRTDLPTPQIDVIAIGCRSLGHSEGCGNLKLLADNPARGKGNPPTQSLAGTQKELKRARICERFEKYGSALDKLRKRYTDAQSAVSAVLGQHKAALLPGPNWAEARVARKAFRLLPALLPFL